MWQENVPLSKHTTFGIGGRAAMFCRPRNIEELQKALSSVRLSGRRLKLLGGGSNVLVDDGDLDIAVISIASQGMSEIRTEGAMVKASGGVRFARFLKICARNGLGGLECLAGIPGTLAGALVGNAGAHGVAIGDAVVSMTVLDDNQNMLKLEGSQLDFGYRRSNLKKRTVVEVEMRMVRKDPKETMIELTRYREKKRSNQPIYSQSAGCVFKNPNGDSAGRLIDLCGLKGKRVGGAEVSTQHANFIINRGGASAGDVLRLVDVIGGSVYRMFKVDLEMEIEHWAA